MALFLPQTILDPCGGLAFPVHALVSSGFEARFEALPADAPTIDGALRHLVSACWKVCCVPQLSRGCVFPEVGFGHTLKKVTKEAGS